MAVSKEEKLNRILELIEDYVSDSDQSWKAGEDWVKYAGSYFDTKEYTEAVKTLLSGWLVLGEDAMAFERKFPRLFGKQHGVLTNSGSSGNLLMMSAMKSKRLYNFPEKTKVIVPIAGFPTTLNPIFQVGFEPLFVDIELESLNLNLDQVEEYAKSGAKIITFAHVLANPPNMDRLMEIVNQYDLVLLEDCCDALGTTYDGKPLGSFGQMASCSFYPAHHITMGEGGFVATKTYEQEKVVRSFREWGRGCYCVGQKANLLKCGTCKERFKEWLPDIPNQIFDHKYIYDEIGYNLKPIELQASIGLVQLEKLDEIHSKRKHNYNALFNLFKKYEEFFHLPVATAKSDPSWFAFPLTLKDNVPFKRSEITEYLENSKIQTRTYFAGNIMLQPGYRHLVNPREIMEKFPVSRKVTTDTFFLGTSPVITDEQINYIKEVIERFMTTI
jgi:CDP-6-deoxy-D-xylo-4-hexulose-3-dehydrase